MNGPQIQGMQPRGGFMIFVLMEAPEGLLEIIIYPMIRRPSPFTYSR